MSPLSAFINRHLPEPFAWGSHDCCTFTADWVLACRGVDPMAGLRMTYSNLFEMSQATKIGQGRWFMTDPIGVIGPRMADAGLNLCDLAGRGDVGVFLHSHQGQVMPHAGIAMGNGGQWVTFGQNGVEVLRPMKILAVWEMSVEG
jgi:hypothetical protein